MNAMIPRWEWRTFGTSFGIADERFAARTPEKVQESDETYLLSPVNDANVKAIVNAGGNGMPAYEDLLTAEEKNHVLAYLKTI